MARIRKAWRCSLKGMDGSDLFFGETASKARAAAYREWSDPFPDLRYTDIQVRRAAARDVELPDEHRLVAELTPEQRAMVAHAYGSRGRTPGYRDHYCTPPGDLDALRLSWELGLFAGPFGEAAYGETPGWVGAFFRLTELGKTVARSMLPTY